METTDPTEDLAGNIHEDEELKWVTGPDKKARLLSRFLRFAGGLVFGVIAGLIGALVGGIALESGLGAVLGGMLAFLIVFLLFTAGPLLTFFFNQAEYAATNQRLIKYTGRFGRSLNSVPFEGVQDAEYDVSTVENFFDVGTVTVDTDRGYERIRFRFIDDPPEFTSQVASLASESDGE
jgi:membrane protein YdbS with pleckstrin-like domain